MKALVLALLWSASLAPSALAQTDLATRSATVTNLEMQVTNAPGIVMSASEVASVVRGAARQSIAESLSDIATSAIKHQIEGASQVLRTGGAIQFSTAVNSNDRITNQRLANVHVRYDARPIGGILIVRVELLPLFAGVGSASRADMSREFAQAVDGFNDEAVSNTVIRLTHELAEAYASKM